MSDLDIQIRDKLDDGYKPWEISAMLEIPVDWVYLTMEDYCA
jgi:hypothetical protein